MRVRPPLRQSSMKFAKDPNMFAVIYRFHLRPHQEETYRQCWNIIVEHFIKYCGAIGSCLHKSGDGLWIAYSRWPDKATRDAAWPGVDVPSKELPDNVRQAIKVMQNFKIENADLEQYDDITMDVIEDRL